MNFIVFDLEWNQSPGGKKHSNSRIPFEIIEIGAVKVDENNEIVDNFHRLIKPQVYNWIHDSIHDVIHINYSDLEKGIPFPQAVREFFEWCGNDYGLFTWGNQDLTELQRNMKYYEMLYLLPGPVTYYDVQKLFGLYFEKDKVRRSLEYAIDYLKISKDRGFHRALEDAFYTAEVLKEIETTFALENSSIDVYQNPKKKRDEIYISYPTYDKFVSREFWDKEKLMKDRDVISVRCPVCHCLVKRKLRWFVNNSKVYESISVCQEHGFVKGKIRIRKTDEEKYYAIKTIKVVDEKKAEEIREKRESLRRKKQMKKLLEKKI